MSTSIRVYRDDAANAAVMEGPTLGAKFNKELKAVGNGDGTITVRNVVRSTDTSDYNEALNIPYTRFVNQIDEPLGADEVSTVNAMNSIFAFTGGQPGGLAPVIVSATAIFVLDGEPVNYTMVATNGVGYFWENLPPGVSTVNGDSRRIVGIIDASGESLPHTYTVTMTAVNYAGSDSKELDITVSATSVFVNTKSVLFSQSDYLEITPSSANPLYRPAVAPYTPWTLSFWFKAGFSTNTEQTIFMFGGSNQNNEGRVQIYYNGSNSTVSLLYGTSRDNLTLTTASNSFPPGTWVYCMMVYDGTATPSGAFSAFSVYINGVAASTTNTDNGGFTGEIVPDFFRVGRNGQQQNTLRDNCYLDEVALWASDQSANVATFYNSGSPIDLTSYSPAHWWRMGDGDVYPTLVDSEGTLDATMINMTAADIVSDVPS